MSMQRMLTHSPIKHQLTCCVDVGHLNGTRHMIGWFTIRIDISPLLTRHQITRCSLQQYTNAPVLLLIGWLVHWLTGFFHWLVIWGQDVALAPHPTKCMTWTSLTKLGNMRMNGTVLLPLLHTPVLEYLTMLAGQYSSGAPLFNWQSNVNKHPKSKWNNVFLGYVNTFISRSLSADQILISIKHCGKFQMSHAHVFMQAIVTEYLWPNVATSNKVHLFVSVIHS